MSEIVGRIFRVENGIIQAGVHLHLCPTVVFHHQVLSVDHVPSLQCHGEAGFLVQTNRDSIGIKGRILFAGQIDLKTI